MNREICFFDYKQCFEYYKRRIINIRQAKIRGERIVAKPVLLLAIIDGIESGVYTLNRFVIDEWLERHYIMLMSKYAKPSQFENPTGIDKPFWHLESDGFWHLICHGEKPTKERTPSKLWLIENIDHARFDDELWLLLQNREWRHIMQDFIIEHKLTDETWFGRSVAEGLSAIMAMMIVA